MGKNRSKMIMIFKIIRPLVRDAANSLILLRCIIIYPQFFFLYWPQPIDALDTRILFSTLDMPWLCGPTASGYQRRVMRVRWMPYSAPRGFSLKSVRDPGLLARLHAVFLGTRFSMSATPGFLKQRIERS